MAISTLAARLATYYSRHGFKASAERAFLALDRAVFASRHVVFYCDLQKLGSTPPEPLPSFLKVERKTSRGEMDAHDLQAMMEFWNPKLAERNMEERFRKGASLWLIKSGERLAGYGWTLRGGSIEPYYFPLGPDDVQFFDFHLFPRFRGRAIDWFLMVQILRAVATEGAARAFAEASEWNRASLSSLDMTPFCRLGSVRKWAMWTKSVTVWDT